MSEFKPKGIIEMDKKGYIELSEEQIDKYTPFSIDYDTVLLSFNYGTGINFIDFNICCDYECIEIKKFFGLFKEKICEKISDEYLYNDELEIYFKSDIVLKEFKSS